MRLTDLSIRKLKSPDQGQKTYFDDALGGFGIRVSQGGSKSFVVMFGKRRQLKTIGRYPDMKLADARREAKRVQSDVSLVNSNKSYPRISFADAKDKFLFDCESRNKPRTVQDYRRLLKRHFKYRKNIEELTRQDIMSVIRNLSTTPSESQHAYVAIRTMMNWCVRHGFVDVSPVPSISHKSEPRNRVLSDDELATVYRRADEYGYPYGPIVQLLILTGQRRGEIGGLRWSWIQGDEIIFPHGFAKNKREHRIPIGQQTLKILKSLPVGPDLIFPSRISNEKPFNGWGKAKQSFDNGIDVSGYTLHDLRRTYSSNMAGLGVPIHVTEKLLNHVSGTVSGIAAVYNRHTYMDEMQEAVTSFDSYLGNLISSGRGCNPPVSWYE